MDTETGEERGWASMFGWQGSVAFLSTCVYMQMLWANCLFFALLLYLT